MYSEGTKDMTDTIDDEKNKQSTKNSTELSWNRNNRKKPLYAKHTNKQKEEKGTRQEAVAITPLWGTSAPYLIQNGILIMDESVANKQEELIAKE